MRARLKGTKAFAGWRLDGSDSWVMVPLGTEGEAHPVGGYRYKVHDFITDDGICVPVKENNYEVIE